MTPTLLTLTVLLLAPSDTETPRKPNTFAPSLPQLTDEEEEKLDDIINRFILHDSGRLPGEDGKRARIEFEKLGPYAIPALIRGLNKAAAIDHSCPAVVIAKKLAKMLSVSADTELLEFTRENVGAGVKVNSRHITVIKDLRVLCMVRKAEVVRKGLTFTPYVPAERTWKTMTLDELAGALNKERGEKLKEVVRELGRRRGDDALNALGIAAASYEGDVRDLARDQLGRQLAALGTTALKEKLKDDKAEIRAAAIKVAGEKSQRWGGEFIDLLTDDNGMVREAAHQALVKLNKGGIDFGPAKDAKEAERSEAIKKWRAWWTVQGER